MSFYVLILLGFLGGVIPKTVSTIAGIQLPIYLDPFFIGIVMSIIGVLIGSLIKKPTPEVIQQYQDLHVQPKSEKDVVETKKTHSLAYVYIVFGIVLGAIFVFAYALPYMSAL